jgi:cytochrome c biogenesis factor
MKYKNRSTSNRALLLIYLLLAIVVPFIVLSASVLNATKFHDYEILAKFFRLHFLFLGIPVYIVYMINITKEKFPVKPSSSLLMIFSLILIAMFSIFSGSEDFVFQLELAGLNLYLGINLIFLAGTVYRLFVRSEKGNLWIKIPLLFITLT